MMESAFYNLQFNNNNKCCNKIKIAYMNYINVYYLPIVYQINALDKQIKELQDEKRLEEEIAKPVERNLSKTSGDLSVGWELAPDVLFEEEVIEQATKEVTKRIKQTELASTQVQESFRQLDILSEQLEKVARTASEEEFIPIRQAMSQVSDVSLELRLMETKIEEAVEEIRRVTAVTINSENAKAIIAEVEEITATVIAIAKEVEIKVKESTKMFEQFNKERIIKKLSEQISKSLPVFYERYPRASEITEGLNKENLRKILGIVLQISKIPNNIIELLRKFKFSFQTGTEIEKIVLTAIENTLIAQGKLDLAIKINDRGSVGGEIITVDDMTKLYREALEEYTKIQKLLKSRTSQKYLKYKEKYLKLKNKLL